MRRRDSELAQRLEYLETCEFSDLKRLWREEGLGTPPKIRRRLMAGLLAYHIQAKVLGGLSPQTARRLQQIAGESGRAPDVSRIVEIRIKPGTRLQRVWKNELHEATAIEKGFAYRGKTYASLSVIARTITGTRWSGPAFFGLRDKPDATAPAPEDRRA